MLGAQPALAAEDVRIRQLETDLQQLRIRLDEQSRRIDRLEQALSRSPKEPLVGTIPGSHEQGNSPAATGRQPWHSREPWTQVTEGMSEQQVTKVLGPPTARESFGRYMTLFYRGTVANVGAIGGHVNFMDGRVVAVNAPAFGG
jgi:hypothetical protein